MAIEFTREVRKKLTYEYLGIWTGTLRNTTGAIIQNGVLYFGTNPWYGYGYETGNWQRANQYNFTESYLEFRARSGRTASWKGNREKRPFMADTIHDPETLLKIAWRVKRDNV